MGQDAVDQRRREQVRVVLQRIAQRDQAVGLEPLAQGLQGVIEGGEVEAQDHVAVAVGGRPPADVGAAEDRLEAAGAVAVVVALQQRHPARLAEAARVDQEGVALPLQVVQEAGLVHVQGALAAHRLEVGPAVRYLWSRARCGPSRAQCSALGPTRYASARRMIATAGRRQPSTTSNAVTLRVSRLNSTPIRWIGCFR